MNERDTLTINQAGHLEIGGTDCVDLARRFGTPLYVLDEVYIRRMMRIFRDTLKTKYAGESKVLYAFSKRAEKTELSFEINHLKARAPLKEGDKVGELIVYKDGVEIEKVALLAANDVKKANIFDRIQDVAEGWTAR